MTSASGSGEVPCPITGYIFSIAEVVSGGVEGFAAENDDFAIRQAERLGDSVKELWCGGRRVKQWSEGKAA